MTGNIPSSLSNLIHAYQIELDWNQLSGIVPVSLFKIESLRYLIVSHNNLIQSNDYNPHVPDQSALYTDISYNHTTFNSLEFLAKRFFRSAYSPQAVIPVHKHGKSLAVSAGGKLSNNTYKWFRVGEPDSTVITEDSVFTPTLNGKYYVSVTNAIATQLTLASDTITLNITATFGNSNSIAGKNKSDKRSLEVFPNPANNIVNIYAHNVADIILTNSEGKIILSKTITGNAVIDVNTLANGTYYIKNIPNGEVKKLVVLHESN